MEQKTKINAEDNKQDIVISREFELPLELLFKAFTDPKLIEQWMGTKVLKLENKKYGAWQFETKDGNGKVLFKANGVIHEFVPNQKITRTFEMENAGFGVQLEFNEFQKISDDTSRLNMHVIYETVGQRDQVLQKGMKQGINWAHNRLEEVVVKLITTQANN